MGQWHVEGAERRGSRRRAPAVEDHALPELGPAGPSYAVMAMQRAAGNRAVTTLLAPRQVAVQRGKVKTGEDPLKDLEDAAARGLLYGTSTARKETSKRLAQQDVAKGLTRRRTIDAYNLDAGINDVMGQAATGIITIREALEQNSIAAWSTSLPKTDPNLQTDDDLKEWIAYLKQHKDWIGLYDLAGKGSSRAEAKKRMKGTRFGKNLRDQAHATNTALTRDKITGWLRKSRKAATAGADLARKFSKSQIADLNKWIYSAFFRRTSKLGIDFTTYRGHTIHFNISGAPKWDPSQPLDKMKMKKGGLKKIHADYGRLITSSEYHHATKRIKEGAIPKKSVNFYDEYA